MRVENTLPLGKEAAVVADIPPSPEGGGLSSTTGHLLTSKCRGGGDFPGEQPHQCLSFDSMATCSNHSDSPKIDLTGASGRCQPSCQLHAFN